MHSPAGEPAIPGFALAGGQSTRMGRDKALVELAGKPLIAYAVECLRAAGLEAAIAGARSTLHSFAPVLPDAEPDRGPLSGICTALQQVTGDLAVFLSVDTPLLPASLLRYMLFHAQSTGRTITLASVNGFPQTFPAVLRTSAWPSLRAELDTRGGGCFAGFRAAAHACGETPSILPAELLAASAHAAHPRALPVSRWFANVNSPAELAWVQQWIPARIA